jgi:hypothetical protein
MFIAFITTVLIGLCSWVYVDILTRDNMIFGKASKYLNSKLPDYLWKPIIGCSYCVSGQISLWWYFAFYFEEYSFFEHIVFVCISIFVVSIINKIMYEQP